MSGGGVGDVVMTAALEPTDGASGSGAKDNIKAGATSVASATTALAGGGGGGSAFRGSLDRLAKRERAAFAMATTRIDELLALLQTTADALAADGTTTSLAGLTTAVNALSKDVGDCKTQVAKEFKGLFTAVTDFGAELDKNVSSNLEAACKPDVFPAAVVTQIIADSLLRDGRFAIAQTLADEVRARNTGSGSDALSAAAQAVDAQRGAFEEMHAVVTALRARNVQPALNWATKQRAALLNRAAAPVAPSGATAPAVPAVPSHADLKYPTPTALSSAASSASAMDTDDPQNKPGGTAGTGPRGTSASSAAASASTSATSSSAPAASLDGVNDLLFALHRLRFLQLLTADSPCTVHHMPASASSASSASSPVLHATTAATPSSPASSSSSSTAAAAAAVAASAGDAAAATPPSKTTLTARISQYTLKAIGYAQQNFEPFKATHLSEIQRLSGCVLFGWDLTRCAAMYPELNSAALWVAAEDAFRVQCYASIGVAQRSPLLAALHAGDAALPKVLKHAAVTQSNAHLLAYGRDAAALAVDLDPADEHQYHTTFICPVTKEPGGADNPPVLLRCGHVISTQAMHKMMRSNRLSRSGRFKCPTCPKEQLPTETLTLHF